MAMGGPHRPLDRARDPGAGRRRGRRAPPAGHVRGAARGARRRAAGAIAAEGAPQPGVREAHRGDRRARRRDPVAAHRQHRAQRPREARRLRARRAAWTWTSAATAPTTACARSWWASPARRPAPSTAWTCPPERITLIGDTPLDIEAAHANGARAVAVATGPYTRRGAGAGRARGGAGGPERHRGACSRALSPLAIPTTPSITSATPDLLRRAHPLGEDRARQEDRDHRIERRAAPTPRSPAPRWRRARTGRWPPGRARRSRRPRRGAAWRRRRSGRVTSTATTSSATLAPRAATAAPTARRRRWRRPCPARNSPMPSAAPQRQPGAHGQPGAAALGRLLARGQRHAGQREHDARATSERRGRRRSRCPRATGIAGAERGDRRHHGHRAHGQAAVERGQARHAGRARAPRAASAAPVEGGLAPLTADAPRASSTSATPCDTTSTASTSSVRAFSPPMKSASPQETLAASPSATATTSRCSPPGRSRPGRARAPSSTASSAPRSHSAPAAGSS